MNITLDVRVVNMLSAEPSPRSTTANGPQDTPTRTGYHHGSLRAALLDGARAMLAERGEAGFSLSALARRVGVSTAAPYRHFADREALLCEIADEGYRTFGASLNQAAQDSTSPADAILRLGVAYLRFAADEPALFDVMFRGGPRASGDGPPSFRTLLDAVVRAQEAGALPPDQPSAALARTIWATLHGLAVLDARGGLDKLGLGAPHERLVAESFASLLRRPE